MTKRIVVGFDGSPGASTALGWAVGQARLHGAELVALAVVEEPFAPPHSHPDEHPDKAAGTELLLERLRRSVREASGDLPTVFQHASGDAATRLAAAGRDADLLVVGSRGRGTFARLLLGSVSRACLHHACCPVSVVPAQPPPAPAHGRVIVGIDGSEPSRRALRAGAEEARVRGAALQAIHAVHWDRLGVELIAPTTVQLVEWGKHMVETELARAEVTARPVILNGHAAEVLVRHSTHADLLVLGSQGHNALSSLVLGSTSDYCAHHAACPVMVVR